MQGMMQGSVHLPVTVLFRDVIENYRLLAPLLAERGRCPPGYGNNDVNLSIYVMLAPAPVHCCRC
jgi:hypothetical protein